MDTQHEHHQFSIWPNVNYGYRRGSELSIGQKSVFTEKYVTVKSEVDLSDINHFITVSYWMLKKSIHELWNKNVFCEVTVTFNLWPLQHSNFIVESRWIFVPICKKFPQGVTDVPCPQEWGRMKKTQTAAGGLQRCPQKMFWCRIYYI